MAVTVDRPSIPPLHSPTTTTHRPADFNSFTLRISSASVAFGRGKTDKKHNTYLPKKGLRSEEQPKLFFAQAF
eukprot:scaffold26319_cov56-Phaeocystis_antarctica.AAC.6